MLSLLFLLYHQRMHINLLKPACYFTHHQVLHSTILHGDYLAIICFMWLSERRVTFALYIVKSLVFITEVESVYIAVRTEYLYKTDTYRP
jgi:hypothetical protein